MEILIETFCKFETDAKSIVSNTEEDDEDWFSLAQDMSSDLKRECISLKATIEIHE